MNRVPIACAIALVAHCSIASDCTRTSTGLIPLNELGAALYRGQFQGGLYPGGVNTVPVAHATDGMARATQITPRNNAGTPSPTGKIVFLSIGMSNATQEFCGGNYPTCQSFSFFGQAAASPGVNHSTLVIVDGAIGGQTPPSWDMPTDPNYNTVRDVRLAAAGVTEAQVQAIWIKEANPQPNIALPSSNADAYTLERGLGNMVRAMKVRYPNLQIVYLSNRIYAGYANTALNPEPYAYETGFAVKWLIQAQIQQLGGGGIDPVAGDLGNTLAPWLIWGPNLWADGLTPRSDGLTWLCSDLNPSDGTHPATGARTKVGTMLLNTLLTSPFAANWFRNNDPACPFIFVPPSSISTCGGGTATFTIDAAAHAPMTLQWRHNGVPIPGESGSTLILTDLAPHHRGQYDCIVTNSCSSITSSAANLAICMADFNCDNQADFFDYLDFVDAFSSLSLDVDFNNDETIDFFDYLDFVDAVSAGC